jgi:serine/threonine-protein kinase SRPK3
LVSPNHSENNSYFGILKISNSVLTSRNRDQKVDIWNLGVLIPELVSGRDIFSAKDSRGAYGVARHLEEIAALCGPFPKSLLKRGNLALVTEVFDEEGNVKVKELDKAVGLEKRVESLDGEEGKKFVAFIRRLLVLDPERRPSAKELLDDEWLKYNYDEVVSEEEL